MFPAFLLAAAATETRAPGAQAAAARALEGLGAHVCDSQVRGLRASFQLWATLMGEAEEERTFRTMLEAGERKNMLVEAFRFALGSSDHTLPAIALAAIERFSPYLSGSPDKALKQLAGLKRELLALIGEGVILYPSYTEVAPKHDRPMLKPLDATYTCIFNVLEFPVTQVPLGLSAEGLPLGVQVVSSPGADHRTIAVAQALEHEMGGWTPPPCVPFSEAPSP